MNTKLRRTVLLLPAALAALALAAQAAAESGEPPLNTAAPTISGEAQAGQSLTAEPGGWSGTGVAFEYRWQRCSAPGYSYVIDAANRPNAQGLYPDYFAFDTTQADAPGNELVDLFYGTGLGTVPASASFEQPGLLAESDLFYGTRATDTAVSLAGDPVRVADSSYTDLGVPSPISPSGAITVETWVKPASLPAPGGAVALLEKPGSYRLLLATTAGGVTRARFEVYDGGAWHVAAGATAITTGSVYYLAGTFDGTTLQLYVNGGGDGSADHAGAVDTSADDLLIGAGYHGVIDDTTVYPELALAATEIGDRYAMGRPGGCSDVPGANGRTYAVAGEDVGSTLRVVVTARNSAGSGAAASDTTATVVPAPPANTALPTISGGTAGNAVLTATAGAWTGDPTSYAFEWQRCDGSGVACAPIAGAAGSSYVETAADMGSTVRVVVTASNAGGSGSAASAPTAVVSAPPPPGNVSPPSVIGAAYQGASLTADPGRWANGPTSYGYQWLRCDGPDSGCAAIATGIGYTAQPADLGKYLRVRVTATNAYGSTTADSSSIGPIATPPPPAVGSRRPWIGVGAAFVGYTVSINGGTWVSPVPYTLVYTWERCNLAQTSCVLVRQTGPTSATSDVYAVQPADRGLYLRPTVTATNAGGSTVSWPTNDDTANGIRQMWGWVQG